jgi:hypothetical protein
VVNKRNHLAAFILGMLFIAGCGNSKSFTPTQPLGGTAVSLSLTDTPPTNVDVISFEVTVSGAALNPGNIDLLGATGPQDIDVKKLQVEKAFLHTTGVPATAGPFQSLTLTFCRPAADYPERHGEFPCGMRASGRLQDHAIRFRRGNCKFQSCIEPQHKQFRWSAGGSESQHDYNQCTWGGLFDAPETSLRPPEAGNVQLRVSDSAKTGNGG